MMMMMMMMVVVVVGCSGLEDRGVVLCFFPLNLKARTFTFFSYWLCSFFFKGMCVCVREEGKWCEKICTAGWMMLDKNKNIL